MLQLPQVFFTNGAIDCIYVLKFSTVQQIKDITTPDANPIFFQKLSLNEIFYANRFTESYIGELNDFGVNWTIESSTKA